MMRALLEMYIFKRIDEFVQRVFAHCAQRVHIMRCPLSACRTRLRVYCVLM